MAENGTKDRLLKSWKEIASYLDVSPRTCHRWEERFSLPVRRIGNGVKSGIFAYKDEIDTWLREMGREAGLEENKGAGGSEDGGANDYAGGSDQPGTQADMSDTGGQRSLLKSLIPSAAHRKRLTPLLALVSGTVIVALIATAFLLTSFGPMLFAHHGEPADFRIEKSILVIMDTKGRELWRFNTHLPALLDEARYRQRFQLPQVLPGHSYHDLPILMIKDINRDGHPEVLFSPQTRDDIDSGQLYCFGHEGRQLWKLDTDRMIECGGMTFPPNSVIVGFIVVDLAGDGRNEILCISHALNEWPTRLMVLDVGGRELGTYWNSGQFIDLAAVDIDKDGRREILAAGLNNESRRGCLIVLDSADVHGSSPQAEAEYTCQGLGPGSELYYLLFPRTDVDRLAYPVECMGDITVLGNDTIRITAAVSHLIYDLDFGMRVKSVILSHSFQQKYNDFWHDGKIRPEFTEDYGRELKDTLKAGIIYYDRAASHWTSAPARNSNRVGHLLDVDKKR
jgi:hypothetical protein